MVSLSFEKAGKTMRYFRHIGVAAFGLSCVLAAFVLFCPGLARADGDRITVAVPENAPPLFVRQTDGTMGGFAMETLRAVAEKAGIEFDVLVVGTLGGALDAVRTGRADLIPGIGVSREREREFLFTDPFEIIPVTCFVRKDAQGIDSLTDLIGNRVGTITQSVGQERMKSMPGIKLVLYDTLEEGLFALLGGYVDAFAFSEPLFWKRARAIGVDERLRSVGPPLMELRRAYLVRREDAPLAARLNQALHEHVSSRAFAQSYLKWWGHPRPFWTMGRLALAGGGLLLFTVISLVAWRFWSVTRLNKVLEEARRKLEASEARLNKAQEMAVIGSFEQDLINGGSVCSEGLFKLLGIPPGDPVPTVDEFLEMVHPDDRDEYSTAIRTVRPGADCAVEFRFRPRGGDEYRTAISRFTLETDRRGRPHKRFGAILDITARKRIEAELTTALQAAEAANRSKSEFLANMSHELRTPLNGAMGMMQILALGSLSAEQRDCVHTAVDCCRNLTQLLADILDLSKVEAGKMELFTERFDPAEVIENVRATFRLQAAAKGLTLDARVHPSVKGEVLGDPVRLRQVLFNLVGNALKFTEKGAVTASVCALPGSEPGRCRLLFSVTDTGIGIPGDKVSAMFGAFTQADGAHTRKYQGTGLGLHIVKRLVRLMGGTISVESEVGWGTTIHCCLPFESVETPARAESPAPKAREDAGPKRILVVEDERINQIALCRILEHRGHTADRAGNGEEALVKVARNEYDLIFMDIQMPVMNGVEATRRIRTTEGLGDKRRIPIIALTAHAMSGDREAFLAAGMSGYLAKPVNMDELDAVLAEVLGRRED